MSRMISCGATVFMLVLMSAGPAGDAQKSMPPQTREQLEARVAALQARVRDLERKNESLEGQVRELKMRTSAASSQQIIPDAGRVPENWQPRHINGMTYYLVPLESTASAPTTRPSR